MTPRCEGLEPRQSLSPFPVSNPSHSCISAPASALDQVAQNRASCTREADGRLTKRVGDS